MPIRFVKLKFFLCCTVWVSAVTLIVAQEPPLPEKMEPQPTEGSSPTPTPAAPVPQLIPSPVIPALEPEPPSPSVPSAVPALSQLDQLFKSTPLGKEAEEFRRHVEWRQLQNRVVDDPDLIALRASAEAAPTDLEKRNRLRNYYAASYGRMRALASSPETKTYLDQKRAEHLALLAQPRVRPNGSQPVIPAPKKHPHKRNGGLPSR